MTSFSRLGSANTYDNALRNLSSRQSALSNLQENLTSGKRVVRASDDPVSAAQAERALTRMSRIATDQRALELQRGSIITAESTLGDVTDALQNFRELVVSAGSSNLTAAARTTVAIQLTSLRDQILSLANRKDSNGQPLFSALGSALAPFIGPQTAAPDYKFNGLPGQSVSSEVAIPFTLDGDSAFMLPTTRDGVYNVSMSNSSTGLQAGNTTLNPPIAPTGNPYTINFTSVTAVAGNTTANYDIIDSTTSATITSGSRTYVSGKSFSVTEMPGLSLTFTGTPTTTDTVQVKPSPSLFSVLDDAIRDIGSAANGNAAVQAVTQALGNIDIGMGRVSAVRGQAGELLNRADRITDSQGKLSIQLEADRSRAEDLDLIKGISDFQNQQTGYQAALQSYAQVQKLSLFNYIG